MSKVFLLFHYSRHFLPDHRRIAIALTKVHALNPVACKESLPFFASIGKALYADSVCRL